MEMSNKKQKTDFPPRDGGYLFRTSFEDHVHFFMWWFDDTSTPESKVILDLINEAIDEQIDAFVMIPALTYFYEKSKTGEAVIEEEFENKKELDWINRILAVKNVGEWHYSLEQFRNKRLNNVVLTEFDSCE